MATRRGGQLARQNTVENRIRRLEEGMERLSRLFTSIVGLPNVPPPDKETLVFRVGRLERSAHSEDSDDWLPPDTAPRDGRTRALVLAIASDGRAAVRIALAPRPGVVDARWYVEGEGWFTDIRGWRPLPEIPEGLRYPKSATACVQDNGYRGCAS